MKTIGFVPKLLVVAGTALLAACTTVAYPPTGQPLLLVHGSAEVAGEGPTWCYETLADPDCYVLPDEPARDRLIGAYVPAGPAAGPETEQP